MKEVVILDNPNVTVDRIATGAIAFSREYDGDFVLLVTSLKSPYWVLPKGGLEEGITMQENAAKELREEAGVVATIRPNPVFDGILDYPAFEGYRSKTQREVYFLADYVDISDEWDEAELRDVQWYSVNIEELAKVMPPVQLEILEIAYAAYCATQKQ